MIPHPSNRPAGVSRIDGETVSTKLSSALSETAFLTSGFVFRHHYYRPRWRMHRPTDGRYRSREPFPIKRTIGKSCRCAAHILVERARRVSLSSSDDLLGCPQLGSSGWTGRAPTKAAVAPGAHDRICLTSHCRIAPNAKPVSQHQCLDKALGGRKPVLRIAFRGSRAEQKPDSDIYLRSFSGHRCH